MKILIFLAILCVSKVICHSSSESSEDRFGFEERFRWGILDFKFPNASIRREALSSGSYIPTNNALFSMAIWNKKIFVSLFRTKIGVLSSLNYFTMGVAKSPVLIPYPSFDDNYVNEDRLQQTLSLNSDSSIISAGFIYIDQCDRLWLVDSGYTDYLGVKRVIASPAIVIIDLKTNLVLRRITIPAEFINSNSVFINVIVDCGGSSCGKAFAYITDAFRSLLVYSYKTNRFWRLTHNFFGSDPEAGNFWFGKMNFQWNLGIFGLAIGEYSLDGSRRVYITPFSSTKTYYISNSVLQNETYVSLNNYYNDVHYLGERGKRSQVSMMSYDEKTNVLFDTEFHRGQIRCWNPATNFTRTNLGVVYKSKHACFPIDEEIDQNRNLWVLAVRYPTFLACTWNANDKNMQMFKIKLDNAIDGTICAK